LLIRLQDTLLGPGGEIDHNDAKMSRQSRGCVKEMMSSGGKNKETHGDLCVYGGHVLQQGDQAEHRNHLTLYAGAEEESKFTFNTAW